MSEGAPKESVPSTEILDERLKQAIKDANEQVDKAVEILQNLKKTNPEYTSQVDEYIKQIYSQVRVAPQVKK